MLVELRLDGAPGPTRLPAMREALIDGQVGVDGLLAVAGPAPGRCSAGGRRTVPVGDLAEKVEGATAVEGQPQDIDSV